ncbi:TPA: hypothetical protein ACVU5C_003600 [Vibrio parahaemolyticus]|nr:hypothetical protein [Vibrio parahaemolyticus]EGR3207759.1 hypothetical protein [Vibrio parahaemolyticus]EID7761421.1 hypothetical protein [Vibrio parahaemolyticus]EJG2175978.1 hypothetical protein [Vibrio parahaemolyticus]
MTLNRDAAGLLKELKSGQLSIGERIKKNRELVEILNKLTGANQKVEQKPVSSSDEPISVEEFSKLGRSDKIEKLNEVILLPNWYEYEMAFFPNYQVVEKGDNYVVYKNGESFQFGYKGHIARGLDYWKNDAGSAKKNGGFGSWSRADRNKAIKTLTKHIEQNERDNGERPVEQSELVARFLAGEFNNAKPSVFVDVMRDVHSEGLELDSIKQKAIEWFEHNPDKLAA